MTYRPRKAWTNEPAADVHPFYPPAVEGVAVHWNGPSVPVAALADPRQFLRGVWRFHTSKGWSDIGYNLAVDQQGDVWELRGLGHRSAANGNTDLNARFVAVFAVIGEDQQPSDRMLAGVRQAVTLTRQRYPKATRIVGHKDIRPGDTACPGPALYRALKNREFEPPPPLKELLDMKLTDTVRIPATYASNQTGKDGQPKVAEEVSVETLLRRVYDWAFIAAHGGK